jgi:hypothetical protein
VCLGVAEQPVDRFFLRLAQQIPHGGFDAGERMGGLQEIHAVITDLRGDARDVGRLVQRRAEDRRADGSTGAVRHRANESRDRNQWRSLALAPPDMATGPHTHE